MAATGLAQNFAAMHALVTEGIQKGHMKYTLENRQVIPNKIHKENFLRVLTIHYITYSLFV